MTNNLLRKERKKDIPLYEREFTKKRRNMKKGANRPPPRESVRIVLERQKDIEAQFWSAHCRQVWAKIMRLCQEACYGCSHRETDKRHHNTGQMSDEDCILRFMDMALGDVRCLEVIREWYDGLSGLNTPLSETKCWPALIDLSSSVPTTLTMILAPISSGPIKIQTSSPSH